MQKGSRSNKCKTCKHPEVVRIDFLIARGAPLKPLARRFGISANSLFRHAHGHVSEEYRRAVKIGPFASEDELRKLCADGGISVLESLRSLYGGLSSRWLVNYEAGADDTLALLTARLHQNLELQARLTRELLPAATTITNNFFALPIFADLQASLLRTLASFPEARAAVIAEFKALADRAPPLLIEAPRDRAA
jgi:hypothetical protein